MTENSALYMDAQNSIEVRVDDLLKRMTLDEKIAQTLGIWEDQKNILDEENNLSVDQAKVELKHGMGTISTQLFDEVRKYGTPGEDVLYRNTIQKFLIENTRLGIPVIFHGEGLHGLWAPGSTTFPQAIALASTWNPELIEDVFTTVAKEMRARGMQHVLSPVLDVARDPRWGRIEETYGEDPHLVAQIGLAAVRGFQGRGDTIDSEHVAATAKHFAGHGQPESGTNAAPMMMPERMLREVFFKPFEVAVKEGNIRTVMASYNEIDGIPSHKNKWLLDSVLRKEFGFDGIIIADYYAIRQLEDVHHVVVNMHEAGKAALTTGVDVELPDPLAYKTLKEQILSGSIEESVLDAAVRRVLALKFELGLFENPYSDPEYAKQISVCPEHRALSLKAAHESIILLKNENHLLPLNKNKIKKLAVIGPNAKGIHLGGYNDEPRVGTDVLTGITNKIGNQMDVKYAEGCKITLGEASWHKNEIEFPDNETDQKLIDEAVEVANESDIALLVIGGNEETSREAYDPEHNHRGDRSSLELIGRQNDLVKAVLATGTPVIVLLIHGRPLAIHDIAEHVPAILDGWYLGQETGFAVADILFGDVNPSGKLPVSVPRNVGQLPAYYSKKPSANRKYLLDDQEPLFPFGHGLSYTTFEYSDLRVGPDDDSLEQEAYVSVDVTNTGSRQGKEIVQLYIRDRVSSVARPVMELKGFKKITLDPKETETVSFVIKPDMLAFWNEDMEYVIEPGIFDVMVGTSSVSYRSIELEIE